MKKRILTGILCIMSILCFSGCSKKTEKVEAQRELFAMDTYMTLTAYGEEAEAAADAAVEEIMRLEKMLSTGDSESEVAMVNVNGGGKISEDTKYLLERATELYKATEGAFDITIYPLMKAWGFTTQEYQVPQEKTLQELLALTDGMQVKFDEGTQEISFGKNGMQIDFGGIAKGYTSARIIDIWKEYEIERGMVNLGGNVQVLGKKEDGSSWNIAIQNPDDASAYAGVLKVRDKAVITSGGYERYFEENGKSYHHIIDPATGYPAESGLVSVTIVSEDGTLADGLSTSLFVMGKEKAIEFWREHAEEFDVILMTDEQTLYVTEGIADDFMSDYPVEVIGRE